MSVLSIVSQNPFDDLPDELIDLVTRDLDGSTTRSRFDSTCRRFYSKSTHLFEATKKFFQVTSEGASGAEGEKAVEEFFQKYKKRMGEFNLSFLTPQHEKFLVNNFEEMLSNLFPVTDRLIGHLDERIAKDIIEEYSCQPVMNMNIENFTQCILSVRFYFAAQPIINVINETKLRQAIKRKHGPAEFEAVRMQFLKPAPALLSDTQAKIERELNLEKKSLEERMFVLRGPHHFDGAIDAAYKALESARKAFFIHYYNTQLSSDEALASFDFNWYTRHDFSEAVKLLQNLKNELAQIAQFDESGEIIEGRLYRIGRALEPGNLQQRASDWAFKMASFYAELNRDVGESDESHAERYQFLHSIIDV